MIFLRLFFGFMIQVMPFAVIAIYPCVGHLRFSAKRTMWMTVGVVAFLAFLFSALGSLFYRILPSEYDLVFLVNILFLCCVLQCFLYFSYVVRVTWQEKLFIFSFLLTSALALTSVCNIILSWIYQDNAANDELPYYGIASPVILVCNLAVLPFLLHLLKNKYRPVSDSLSKKENRYLSVLSLALFFILGSGLIFIDYSNIYDPMTFFLYIALLIMVFLIYFIFFKMLDLSHEKLKAQQDSLNLQHQLEIRNEQYLRFNESIEGSRRMRHDLRHHMLILNGYMDSGEYEKAKEYLNQRIQDVNAYEISGISNIPVINWILNYYKAQAQSNHVPFQMHVSSLPPEAEDVPAADFAVLLGNLLENALIAASDTPVQSRFINLHLCCFGKMLAVTIDNSFNGNIKKDGTKYLSTKKDHTGIGLKSIELIAEKYDGGVEFTHEASVFRSSIMLNISRFHRDED